MSLGQDGFRMTQKIPRRLSESDQKAREQSYFIIPSESKILRLVKVWHHASLFRNSAIVSMFLSF